MPQPSLERFGAMCDLLYSMERELGIAKLAYPEKRIIQVASIILEEDNAVSSGDLFKLCEERYKMSRATFFRALKNLENTGKIRKDNGRRGYYSLSIGNTG